MKLIKSDNRMSQWVRLLTIVIDKSEILISDEASVSDQSETL
jgi:hypothetical protein